MLLKDDSAPSNGRLYKNKLADGTNWLAIEVRDEWNGMYTNRLGMLNIRMLPNGDMTASLVEEDR